MPATTTKINITQRASYAHESLTQGHFAPCNAKQTLHTSEGAQTPWDVSWKKQLEDPSLLCDEGSENSQAPQPPEHLLTIIKTNGTATFYLFL